MGTPGGAAAAAFELEQQKAQAAYLEMYGLLATDAACTQDAQEQALLDQLRIDAKRTTDQVKAAKQKAMLVSAENVSKQELIDSMSNRLEDMSKELGRLSVMQVRAQAGAEEARRRSADEQAARLRKVFESTMELAVSNRLEGSGSRTDTAHLQHAGPRSTAVYYCPDGQPKEQALATTHVRLGRATSFREVTANAARHFSLPAELSLLEDDNETLCA